jgi:hypothetical protein
MWWWVGLRKLHKKLTLDAAHATELALVLLWVALRQSLGRCQGGVVHQDPGHQRAWHHAINPPHHPLVLQVIAWTPATQ